MKFQKLSTFFARHANHPLYMVTSGVAAALTAATVQSAYQTYDCASRLVDHCPQLLVPDYLKWNYGMGMGNTLTLTFLALGSIFIAAANGWSHHVEFKPDFQRPKSERQTSFWNIRTFFSAT